MKTVSHVSGKIDCDGVKKGRGGEERRAELDGGFAVL